jgi:hypothetical protein
MCWWEFDQFIIIFIPPLPIFSILFDYKGPPKYDLRKLRSKSAAIDKYLEIFAYGLVGLESARGIHIV